MKIGVRIDHFVPGSESHKMLRFPEIRDYTQQVENGGLDSIWLSDHMLYRFQPEDTFGPWECWTLLTALAVITNRVQIGTLVLCNPFRNPALLAKMAHTLDEISGGRLILGLGSGWHQPEFDAYDFPFDKRVDRFEEALQILSPLLKGKGVDFIGTHYRVKDCVVTPSGPREEGIPLLVGAHGPRMMQLTAQYADQWNTAWMGDPQDLVDRLQRVRQACTEVGRDPDTLKITASASVSFPDLEGAYSFAQKPITGSTQIIADAFHRYDEMGVNHLILQPTPHSLPALKRVIEAVNLYRADNN